LKDEVKTGNKYDKYLMHVSLIEREGEVLLKEDEHQIFDLYMWDTTKKWNFSKKVTFVHPMSHWCFYTLELRHDSRKGRIYVGYENEGRFYCFYEIWTDDSSYEEFMKEGPERAEGVVYGNMYFKYKKQIIPTQLLQQ
jgi:outer membrane protein assembly factor BamB